MQLFIVVSLIARSKFLHVICRTVAPKTFTKFTHQCWSPLLQNILSLHGWATLFALLCNFSTHLFKELETKSSLDILLGWDSVSIFHFCHYFKLVLTFTKLDNKMKVVVKNNEIYNVTLLLLS